MPQRQIFEHETAPFLGRGYKASGDGADEFNHEELTLPGAAKPSDFGADGY